MAHAIKKIRTIPALFENDDCLVFNKPAGLPVQGGEKAAVSLDSMLGAAWSPKPLLVHRLDRDTSGIILVAKHREAAARFSALFSRKGEAGAGGIVKQYLAVCAGRPCPDAGSIRLDLEIRGAVKKSETRYRRISGLCLAVEDGEGCAFSLVELELGTGRMHQIRRHLAGIGHPVLGDDKYGDFALNKTLRKALGLRRLLLHASRLVISGDLAAQAGFSLDISAPLPDYFGPFTTQLSVASGQLPVAGS
ncbi:MAG: RluA family pseudouridine synthase [Treponema sp.]|jgi:23S rRNA pseudouridine955/2504/2580 synthase|nr:RluA family pseudouridine synthase [Treponema sp.]